MKRFERPSPAWLTGTVSSLLLLLLVVDVVTPLGVANWILYTAPMALMFFVSKPSLPIAVAGIETVLLTVGFFLSPPGPQSVALINRGFGIIGLWILAFVSRQLVLSRLAMQRHGWMQQTHAALSGEIQGEQTVAEVAIRALRYVAGRLEAPVGVLLVEEQGRFQRVATFGYEAAADDTGDVPGRGLVAEAAREGRVRVLDDVPPEHLPVCTALGKHGPRYVVIAPLAAESRVNGAIELGLDRVLQDSERELLERLAEPIGVALRSASYRARLEQLLAETQGQADELQAQQEELEQTNSQLEEQTAALEQQTRRMVRSHEALVANSEALDRANRHKSEFLANMSHELRTPLNSTLVLARLLADNAEGNLSAKQVRFAQTIHQAGNDLLYLINDILDLSKVEAGRLEVHFEPVPVGPLLRSLTETFQPVADDKGLAFSTEIAAGTPGTLFTDALRLRQVLNNLLSNAFKFTDRGGVSLEVAPGGRAEVTFSVRDSGPGITEEQHELIFEPFGQSTTPGTRGRAGTGLGLSIARELSRLLGGRIELESAPDRGSTFRVSLPAGKGRPAAVSETDREPAPMASIRSRRPPSPVAVDDDRDNRTRGGRLILVVEDDGHFAGILRDLAHELEFDCVIAPTAEEGLALAGSLLPCGILLDVALPDGSGLALLDRLKRSPATRHLPVHVISVSEQSEMALGLGAVGYTLKPVERAQLADAIRSIEQKGAGRTKRVLVIEGDSGVRESIADLLEAADVEIVGVGTAAAALERLAAVLFDCVVLDLSLPDGNGYDLLDCLAARPRHSLPPVIVYTAGPVDAEGEQRLRRYAESIIIKGARSPDRLYDEVTLFLHQVESQLPANRQRALREVRDRDEIFTGRQILLVEDDVRNVFAMTSALEPRGVKLEVARDGQSALDVLDRMQPVDLVLMDLMMPGMDGLTATRAIRRRPEYARLPIIALTAKATAEDRQRCLAAGANDYLAKPFELDKLLSLCRVWMAR